MFGADRAAERMDKIMHRLAKPGAEMRMIGGAPAFLRKDVVVQIAITEMAETVDPKAGVDAGHGSVSAADEFRDARDRKGDVMADDRADPAIAFGQKIGRASWRERREDLW